MRLTDDMLLWIDHNAEADPDRLRFRHGSDPVLRHCILQIESRRRAARKLTDTLQCRQFQFPTALSAEQCTSDALARFHASLIEPGASVLDMTAGLGIDTFHIAHRASSVTAIDIDPDVAEALACNAEALGLPNVESVCTDSVQYLHDTQRRFDTIFIDPARRGQGGKRLFALADCNPDVTALLPMLADRCHKLIIKASPMLDICHTLEEIPCATHLYVTGTRHECKELVIVCDFNAPAPSTPAVTALTIDGETSATFTFTYAEEHTTEPSIAEPKAGQILYEPYPALLKSGAFRLLCPRFGCTKPHQNSHLYMADRPVADFPGTPYIIDDVIPFSSSEIRRIRERITSASIATRNFILSADELRRKLKLKEDPRRRIIGTTTQSGRILITTSPLSEPN